MGLTDDEILELEQLLEEEKIDELKDGLIVFNDKTSPNYKILHDSINGQKWGFDKEGKPKLLSGYTGAVLEGSSRSTKTWGSIFIIIYLATIKHEEDGCTINVYRETYNEFKTTLYDDFKRILNLFGLDNPFERAKEISSFKILNTKVNLLGDGKFGGGCDYAFFNEVMFIREEVFKQVKMRCRIFWWMDFNPCFTDHWVFNTVIPREDVNYLKTTFRENKYISPNELNEILAYEPWLPGSYEVTEDDVLYNGESISEKNQPPPHPKNVKQGTASVFDWKVYGLGLRGAMKGVVFNQLTWIEEFPDVAYTYANDFGFTADPNATVRYAEDENNIWFELLIYESVETPDRLDEMLLECGVEKHLPLACDSSDKYTGENKGTVEMVQGLVDLGWDEAFKISKTKSIMFWLLSMKRKKIHCVKNKLWKHVKKERENYKFKEVNGIQINQPIDKYNHVWDAVRYGHMSHNSGYDIFY
ncbi:terminase large subunit [Tenacibaculum caenipelagi]|uniref:PBSX family phage terminase large subunit n=1 Tax=Tenacibaculum caenipelagi TaxID=1325435 RepID=A0A4R6TD75_9FLAO|nr:terminase large subunit [Tenacibaculum caenipelagi]TDQ27637.1 PBSX family phage terminase large subunit [Tenacibaculum caenipelagi]